MGGDVDPHQQGYALGRQLARVLEQVRRRPGFEPLRRIAVALYDERRDMLCSFAYAGEDCETLDRHEYPLSEVPSLALLAAGDGPRVIDDLASYGRDTSPHTAALRKAGYRSSLTVPVYDGERLSAFIFYNALTVGFFRPAIVHLLQPLSGGLVGMVRRQSLGKPVEF